MFVFAEHAYPFDVECSFQRIPQQQEMKARGVGVDEAVDDYNVVKDKLGADADTSGSRFNDAFRIARAENQR